MKGTDTECVVLVLLEMGLSFAGIVTNLLIVTAVKASLYLHWIQKYKMLNHLFLISGG